MGSTCWKSQESLLKDINTSVEKGLAPDPLLQEKNPQGYTTNNRFSPQRDCKISVEKVLNPDPLPLGAENKENGVNEINFNSFMTISSYSTLCDVENNSAPDMQHLEALNKKLEVQHITSSNSYTTIEIETTVSNSDSVIDKKEDLTPEPSSLVEDVSAKNVHDVTGISFVRSVIIVILLAFTNFQFIIVNFMVTDWNSSDDSDWSSIVAFVVYLILILIVNFGICCNRRYVLCFGMALQFIAMLNSLFIKNQSIVKSLATIGGATYATIPTTIIADLFVEDQLSLVMTIYNVAMPMGKLIGYVIYYVATKLENATYRWAQWVSPAWGGIILILLLFIMKDPPRGATERKSSQSKIKASYLSILNKLGKNSSFIFATLGISAVLFITLVMSVWNSELFIEARDVVCRDHESSLCKVNVQLMLFFIELLSGLVVATVGEVIQRYYEKFNSSGDCIVCALSHVLSALVLSLYLILAYIDLYTGFVFYFFMAITLAMTCGFSSVILSNSVSAETLSTALVLKAVFSQLCGGVGAAFLIPAEIEAIKKLQSLGIMQTYPRLQVSLLICPIIALIGAGLFFATANAIRKNDKKAKTDIKGHASKKMSKEESQ